MILKKFTLEPGQKLSHKDDKLMFDLIPSPVIKIEMLEIYTDNPNNLFLAIGYEPEPFEHVAMKWHYVHFYRHRFQMLHQNNTFIFDTAHLDHIKVEVNKSFEIKIGSVEESQHFKVVLYCAIDKKDGRLPQLED